MVRKTFCSIKVLLITTLALLLIFIGVVVIAFVAVPYIISNTLHSSVRLEEGTIQWERFEEIPFPLHFKVWLFTVTNPDEIMAGEQPILKEVGPYHYDQNIRKNILSTNSTEDSVTYDRNLTFNFNQEKSGSLSEDDEVIVLNTVMLSMTQLTTLIERMALGGCLEQIFPAEYNKMFIKVKVRTMMFEGYEFAIKHDNLGVACNIIRNQIIEKTANLKNIEKIYNEDGELHSLKFSYFRYKEATPDGIHTLIRGLDDVSLLGQIIRWNDDTHLNFWGRTSSINNETCNRVRGTDSTIYPPDITRDSSLDILNTDICRIVKISYRGQETYKGIDAYRFSTDENTFRPETQFPENDCFCVQQTMDMNGSSSCFLDGIIDLKPCLGAPILLSFPHFLFADEKYRETITGVDEPDESIHKIYLLVEPNTGTPLEGNKRVQFNVVLRPASFLTVSESLPRAVLPMFWVDEGTSLEQKYIDELNDKYFNRLNVAAGIKYGMIAVTLAALVTSAGFLIRKQFTG